MVNKSSVRGMANGSLDATFLVSGFWEQQTLFTSVCSPMDTHRTFFRGRDVDSGVSRSGVPIIFRRRPQGDRTSNRGNGGSSKVPASSLERLCHCLPAWDETLSTLATLQFTTREPELTLSSSDSRYYHWVFCISNYFMSVAVEEFWTFFPGLLRFLFVE